MSHRVDGMHRPYVSQRNPAAPSPSTYEERQRASVLRFSRMLRLPDSRSSETTRSLPSQLNSHHRPYSEVAGNTHTRLAYKAAAVYDQQSQRLLDDLRILDQPHLGDPISPSACGNSAFASSSSAHRTALSQADVPKVVVNVEWLNFVLCSSYPESAQHCWVESWLAGLVPEPTVARPRKDLGAARYGDRTLGLNNDLSFEHGVRIPIAPGTEELERLRSMLLPGQQGESELIFVVLSRHHTNGYYSGGGGAPSTSPLKRSSAGSSRVHHELSSSFNHATFSPSLGRWTPSAAPDGEVFEVGRASILLSDVFAARRDVLHPHHEGCLHTPMRATHTCTCRVQPRTGSHAHMATRTWPRARAHAGGCG